MSGLPNTEGTGAKHWVVYAFAYSGATLVGPLHGLCAGIASYIRVSDSIFVCGG